MTDPRFQHDHYTVKEKILAIGRKYRVFDPQGELVAFCKQKAFKLREDIRFYAEESMQTELFRLRTAKILDFNANFEVVDADGNVLGSLRRKGWSSMVQDRWQVHDAAGTHIGDVVEDNIGMALMRRFVLSIIPYHYKITGTDGQPVGTIDERFQLFGDTYDLRRLSDQIDPRVLIGATVCVDAIEGE